MPSRAIVRERMGADTVNIVPHSHYGTKDDKWVALACSNDLMWQRLCEAMDRLDLLARRQVRDHGAALAERDKVNGSSPTYVGSMHRDELLRHCLEHEVPAGPINNIADIFEDPQFAARQNLIEVSSCARARSSIHNVVAQAVETPRRVQVARAGPRPAQRRDLLQAARHVGGRGRALKREGVI